MAIGYGLLVVLGLLAIGDRRLAMGYGLLAMGYWLLVVFGSAIGYGLLAIGCFGVIGDGRLAIGCFWVGHWQLAIGYWLFWGHWRWAIGDWWGDGRLDMGCCWILTIYIQQLKSTSFEGYVLHKNHARVACYKNIKKSVVGWLSRGEQIAINILHIAMFPP